MKKSIKQLLSSYLQSGINSDTPFYEVQKIYFFNLIFLFAIPFAFIVLVINFFSHLYILSLINTLQLIIFWFAFWITKKSKHLNLLPLILIILVLIGVLSAWFFKNGSEYRLLLWIIAGIVLFDNKWKYALFTFFISAAFVAIRLNELNLLEVSYLELTEKTIKILFPLIIFSICLFYLKKIYFEYQFKLEKAISEISAAKKYRDHLLNIVIHDLRSPLSSILGISNIIKNEIVQDTEQGELIQFIKDAATQSLDLINDLLLTNEGPLDQSTFKKTDLNAFIEHCLPALQIKASEKNIQIKKGLNPMPVMVFIVPNKIERVVNNLITNAIKFSYINSTIQVQVYTQEKQAFLVIKDNGIGIAKENQEKIFDTFTMVKRKGTAGEKSYGLGLSICKQIMEQHQGTVNVESNENEGSRFFVQLPLV